MRRPFELGLATHLSEDPRADAFALAREIAGRNPDAIRGAKALLEAAPGRPRAEAFLAESEAIGKLIGSPNQIEAVTAEMEKRRRLACLRARALATLASRFADPARRWLLRLRLRSQVALRSRRQRSRPEDRAGRARRR